MDINIFAGRLDDYLKSRYHLKNDILYINNKVINANRAAFRLYLRCWDYPMWEKNTLIIANIEFRKERCGEGEAFLRFLVSVADEAGIDNVGIESTNIKSSAFAKKFGFHEAHYPQCYTVPITSLKTRFKANSKVEAILA